MNVPVGKSTYAVWVVAIAGFVSAGLSAWQDAPDWVSVVLAALGAFLVTVNNAVRASQANHLVDTTVVTEEPEVLFNSDDETQMVFKSEV
jgi:hypothetical protein